MIWDDQPQMVRAMDTFDPARASTAEVLAGAFAAIDREALIEKAIGMLSTSEYRGLTRDHVQAILVAAGIIPERS